MPTPDKANAAIQVLKPNMKIIQLTFVGKLSFDYNFELLSPMEVKRLVEPILQNAKTRPYAIALFFATVSFGNFWTFFFVAGNVYATISQVRLGVILLSKQKLKILGDKDLHMIFCFTAISKYQYWSVKQMIKTTNHSKIDPPPPSIQILFLVIIFIVGIREKLNTRLGSINSSLTFRITLD